MTRLGTLSRFDSCLKKDSLQTGLGLVRQSHCLPFIDGFDQQRLCRNLPVCMATEKRECYLCGKPATTKDHIPPRGIFPKPFPSDFITAPACQRCNNDSSKDDLYFRDVISAAANDSPESLVLLKQRIIPRMRKDPGIILDLLKSARPVDVYSDGHIYLRRGYEITFDQKRIQAVIDRIVRGLYYEHAGKRLPDDCAVTNYILNPKWEPLEERMKHLPLCNVGDGAVFSYSFQIESETGASAWYLMFHNSTLFVAYTLKS